MWLSKTSFECPQYLLEKTRSLPASRVAVVNAQSTTVLESIAQALEEGLVQPLLIGNESEIRAKAEQVELELGETELFPVQSDRQAVDLATGMVNRGQADCIMKGHISTDELMRGLLDKEKGIRGPGLMTHVFHMTVPGSDALLLISDAVIHVAPDHKAFQCIIRNAIELAHKLGIAIPKVALLSASETVNPAVPSTRLKSEMASWAKQNLTDSLVHGPLAFDVAVSQKAAQIKGLTDPVAGFADVFIVPSIETGNVLYKTLVYYKGACAAGIVMGAKVPVVLTSRADPPEARLASIAIAAILSNS